MNNNIILGFDISTSRIGIAAVTQDEKLIYCDTITFKNKELSLEDKAVLFFEHIKNDFKDREAQSNCRIHRGTIYCFRRRQDLC